MAAEEPAGDAAKVGAARPPLGRRDVLMRLAAAALVALVSLGAKELVLDADAGPSNTRGAKLREIGVRSELLDREMPVNVVVPKGAFDGKRSLVVFLHGRDEDESSNLDQEMFGALAKLRGKAPVMAFAGGGGSSYWHDREDGEWGSYVLDELIPKLVERFEIEPERVAVGGVSMGGYGAYNLARQRPELFCAVGGHSPAVWLSAGETAPGAFDDAADFERNDVIGLLAPGGADRGALDGLFTWIDIGEEDSFAEASAALAEAVEVPEDELPSLGTRTPRPSHRFRTEPGDHDRAYWSGNWNSYIRFYGLSLKACGDFVKALDELKPEPEQGSD